MKTIILLLTLFVAQASFKAQTPGLVVTKKDGWTKIGEVKADFKMESESIVVLGNDKFKAIKVKVKNAPLNIIAIQLLYESGKTENISVRAELQMNQESEAINIEEKSLSKVTFIYKTLPNAGDDKAEVELYGLK